MTALELRHAVAGYPVAAVRAAVEAGLREWPAHDPEAPTFGELVTFWLTDPDAWEWFAPPCLTPRSPPSTAGSRLRPTDTFRLRLR